METFDPLANPSLVAPRRLLSASAPPSGIRTGLRSKAIAEAVQPLEDNPESTMHNRRKGTEARKSAEAPARRQSPVPCHTDRPVQSIEALPGMDQGFIDYGVDIESPDEESSLEQQMIDPEEAFNRKWGYLPPLDEEAAAIIDALIENPANAMASARINPTSETFFSGLDARNVGTRESKTLDQYAANFDLQPHTLGETAAEKESYERLWTSDRAACVHGSNVALFQRTLMMDFIARHCLVYGQDATRPSHLGYSVEETWSCPPMPTLDYKMRHKFLTQPKPDLAVYFKRDELIPMDLWKNMPNATRRLVCYQKLDGSGELKAFHFFTIEGRRSQTVTSDLTALYQSLNNASQALHNMFEFFNDAGPQHAAKLFSEVRFFSAVASTEGLLVRIHRAVLLDEDRIHIPGYPLRFEFRKYARIPREKFDREPVVKLFSKILVSYGTEKLFGLLQDAAETLAEKLKNEPGERGLRYDPFFYSHGQGGNTPKKSRAAASSRLQTLTASRVSSEQTRMSVDTERSELLRGSTDVAAQRSNQSVDTSRGGTATRTQSQSPPSPQVSNSGAKRRNNQTDDVNPPQKTKRLRQ